MSRPLARYVIPHDGVAILENVIAAGGIGRFAVNGVHPAARAAVFLLGQTANRGNIGTIRRRARIDRKSQRTQRVVRSCALIEGERAARRDRVTHGARCDRDRHRDDVARLLRAALIARRGAAAVGCRTTAGRRASARR